MAGELPDLAQLKLAAEGGNPVAQFQYGHRIAGTNPAEQFSWFMRSAEQGYAPAEDVVGARYMYAYGIPTPKTGPILARESARWTSRAAFQKLPGSQIRLAQYYRNGTGLAPDPVKAYMWAQIAFQNPDSTAGERMTANGVRDRIIANTSSNNIREGQRRADGFSYPAPGELNPIEMELTVAELKLVGIFQQGDRTSAAVNNVRFYVGESKDVKISEHAVRLTCISISTKSALFSVGGKTQVTLGLKP